jgi:X-Pro dipeptidyl-peptidase
MSHAFNDWNVMPEHSVRIYKAIEEKGVPVQAYFHQGGHGGPPPFERMNRWFTRFLCGVENGVEDEPRAWIVREGVKRSEPTPYADYPNPDAAPVSLHPLAGGAKTGALGLGAVAKQGAEKLVDDAGVSGAELASAERSKHRLLYATPELKAPVHLSGTSRISIRLASSKPAANLSVWLVSLPWTERAKTNENLISRGWADPQNHASLRHGEPLVPGRFRDLSFDLQPDDQIIPAGARIGLMIFSSDHDFTLWPKPGTELTIDLDATSISLPVVGGREALERALGQRD